MTELPAARRIATASDRRRRQAERAMHDGVQQHLALLSLQVSMLRRQIRRDPVAADALCAELSESLANAQQELRDLAHWVYPAVLENAGLVAALRDSVARLQVPVNVSAEGVSRHEPEIESTAYFCCLDALDNVERYAGDDAHGTVTLSEHDGQLDFSVVDTGLGFDPETVTHRGGLQHAADRVAALGGELRVVSEPGRGATVQGSIPLNSGR